MKNTIIKKVYLLILVFFLRSSAAQGQWIVGINFLLGTNNEVKLVIQSLYGHGDGMTHFGEMYDYSQVQKDDTIYLKVYYLTHVGLLLFTGYTDTLDLGIMAPHSANVLIIYPYNLNELDSTTFDTTAFHDPDTTVLFPWPNSTNDLSTVKHSFKVFPNPVGEQLSVTNASQKEIIASIVVTDITSKIVYSAKQIKIGQSALSIDTGSFTAGTYFIRIIDNEKRQHNYHFTKL